jgi:hypothetical protein
MAPADAYALGFTVLAAWGTFTASRLFTAGRPWSRLRRQVLLADALLVASCLLCASTLRTRRFAPWMLVPLGASYLWMVPLPCYLEFVNRGRLHVARNALFLAVALLCFALGFGLVPLALLGV